MNARTLSAGLAGVALLSPALGCDRADPASTILASSPVHATASRVQASHKTVLTLSGDVVAVDGSGVTVHLGAHASGPAGSLSGQGFDSPGKPPGAVPPGFCRFPLTGSLVGSVVTLTGNVTFSPDPNLIGLPVTITANASTGDITFDFAGFILSGSGSVVIAHD